MVISPLFNYFDLLTLPVASSFKVQLLKYNIQNSGE